jgi:O-antigen/teichoic acid export membrane protein
LANFAATGISALAGVVMARGLGPEGRGQVAIVMSWFAVVQAISEGGLSGASVYFTARHPTQSRQILQSIRLLALAQGTLGAIAGIGVLHFVTLPDDVRAGLITAFALMPFVFWMSAPLQSCQALSLRKWNLARLGQALIYLMALMTLLQTHELSVVNVTVAFLFASAAAGILGLISTRDLMTQSNFASDRITYRNINSYASRNWAWTVLTIVGLRLDQLTLSVFASPQQLGLYVAATTYMALGAPLLSAVGVVTFTTAARGSTINVKNARLILTVAAAISVTAAGSLAILAPHVIPYIFGQDFASASQFAILLAAGAAGSGVKQVASNLLLGSGQPSRAARLEALYVLCLGVSLLFAVISFGPWGAAISYSIVTVVFAVVTAVIAGTSQPRFPGDVVPVVGRGTRMP